MDIEIPHAGADAAAGPATAVGLLLAAAAIAACAWAAARLVARTRRGQPPVDWRPHGPVAWNGGDVAFVGLVYAACQILAAGLVPRPPTVPGQLAASAAAMLAATIISMAHLRGRGGPQASLGIDLGRLGDDTRLGLGALALIVAPLLALAAAVDRIVPYRHPIIDFLAAHRGPAAIAMVAASAVIVAPIAEEFLFRRVLQGWLEKWLAPGSENAANASWRGVALALTISAVAFAAAHVGQGLAWVPLFFFGLVTGVLARQTGSIVPGIILHGLFNAVSVVLVLWQTR
jgi:membrane protease YdiL (CAAX protease family)